ncbi:MAG: cytochrome c oxidase accessory protein CcoG [Leptospiraceae bacterium]|nr:cytochrome c oxidase accessory protein CcoG [Leptospiraceae bacterium]MCP5495513.1 cytochrome c oxidase accessory protein CcoG [Leptospiraceae bacterium]
MVISRHVSGKFRNTRYLVEALLFLVYFTLPWLRMEGKPIILLDIPARNFYLLGSIYIPQEVYFLLLFLILMGLSLFFFTSLIGRVWCGWACPQTIFTDVFDIFGHLILRKKYGKKDAPVFRKVLLHIVWIVVSFVGAFHFIAYFNDAYDMQKDFLSLASHEYIYPYFILFFTATLYLDMTVVREQFCKLACPYARFQTILMDNHTYNVIYDHKRGEPRRNKKEKIGDCTACNMCLVVCPTGIDIREGTNVGCIACGKCVDACTIQMAKENKKTLIRYDSEDRVEKKNTKIKWIRPRTVLYGSLLLLISSLAVFLISTRVPLFINAQPDRNIAPMVIPGNKVRSFYNVKIRNMTYKEQNLKFEIDNNTTKLTPIHLLVGGENSVVKIPENSMMEVRVILETPNLPEEEKYRKVFKVWLKVSDMDNPRVYKRNELPILLPNG